MSNESDEFEQQLRLAWEKARKVWPSVALAFEPFRTHLQGIILSIKGGASSPAKVLETLAVADLYLACACLQGMSSAIQVLEDHFLARLPSQLGSRRLSASVIDEVCQLMRIHLLVGTREMGPQLASYKGQGPLETWLRISAARMAVKLSPSSAESHEEDVLESLAALPAPEPSPELELIRSRYRRDFLQALRDAFKSLSPDQRHLLRLHFGDGLSTPVLGRLFAKNQSTIWRRLQEARMAVYEETKRLLGERLGLNSKDFMSLLWMLDSQLNLSLSQVLSEEEDGPTSKDKPEPKDKPKSKDGPESEDGQEVEPGPKSPTIRPSGLFPAAAMAAKPKAEEVE
ncbi:sigma factor-like helix-turn-helix DNA-binding protein [Melittangium boletus]|uniref:sigma factor-like helix-turn-helix DNA-binding protein n=1 Tax=Melittangium boletus TaxID=83453 RepID=UPI001FE8C6C9|nr:sigma factor-like helix-turn-helix DNA-binding protein [Melittangium boletus]